MDEYPVDEVSDHVNVARFTHFKFISSSFFGAGCCDVDIMLMYGY